MSKRIILILIIIILIVILGLAGYYGYMFYFTKPAVDANSNSINTPQFFNVNVSQDSNQNINSPSDQPQVDVSQDDRSKIQSLAIIFSQNFGTYSNQTDLTNFDEIFSFMGETMKKWVKETYKVQIMREHPQTAYYAVETKVLNTQITEIDEAKNTAAAMLKTQRQEFVATPDNVRIFEQDLLLNLVKVNDNWIVDSAYWQ